VKRLHHVVKEEKLDVDDGAYSALVYASEGDMRKAINYLQTASALEGKISEDTVYKVAARAKPAEIKELLSYGLSGKFEEARKALDALLFEYGMSGEEVILQVYREIINSPEIEETRKVQLIDRLGEYNFRITEGANERIQLESFIAYLVMSGR
jgi:replication factor C small subunit